MSQLIDLSKVKKVFFIGIGGIGISATARILKQVGKDVSGSDMVVSEITDQLQQEGIKINIPQSAENISNDIDLIVYTVAIDNNNIEKKQANELGLKQISYPQLLGLLMKDKIGIGVSGTDGKTTTTAMLGKIFIEADLDPTIVVGSKVDYLGGNSRVGDSQYFIFESDEYKKAFHNYYPKIAALTNIRADHLDVYKDLDDIKTAFFDYLKQIPENGLIVVNNDDANTVEVSAKCGARIITYGIDLVSDVMATDIRYKDGKQSYKLLFKNKPLGDIELNIPGKYNIYNTLAAISIALDLGIDFEIIKNSLSAFIGAWRRFEKLGMRGDTQIITDYAHTPEGLKQVIEATKNFYPNNKILFVFQPHQYNRTKNFFNEFVLALQTDENILLTDIFYVEGREDPNDFDVSSKRLAEKAGIVYSGSLKETAVEIERKINDFDVIMLIGAGDIYNLAKNILK